MVPIRNLVRSVLGGVCTLLFWTPCSAQDISQYDVVWTSPSADQHGSMPLGNGDISLNAWIEPSGDLRFYIGKTDSWGEHGRLLKVGKMRVTLDPPLTSDVFAQRLDLENGRMVVDAGGGNERVKLELWVDANEPVVRLNIDSERRRTATAAIELWRTSREAIPLADTSDMFEDRSRPNNLRDEVFVDADALIEDGIQDAIGWHHFTEAESLFSDLIRIQGLEAAFEGKPDPLRHRVFGALVTADRGRRLDASRLRSSSGTTHRFNVHVKTAHPSTPDSWLSDIVRSAEEDSSISWAERQSKHATWWNAFWDRSWIEVTTASESPTGVVPANQLPIRIGIDQSGQNRFDGEIGRVTILETPIEPAQAAAWAQLDRSEPIRADGIVSASQGTIGAIEPADHTFESSLGVEAWVRPKQGNAGRIVDDVTPGGSDGWLLDTHPGDSLRFIVGPATVIAEGVLSDDEWSHVAASVNADTGRITLYFNGEEIAAETLDVADDAELVSRSYALQRYIDACAGRGRYPIKFNGSIFNVAYDEHWGDADYRRWGPGYWWQNTRLPYLSMCASGDFDLMTPLFRMYVDDLSAVNRHRALRHAGHDGLFIPECIYFWGGNFAASYGWTPYAERENDKLQDSPWHKREWVSGLELAWMMLDYYEHTEDHGFARERLIPFVHDVLRFFEQHYQLDVDGKLVMEPSQAVETWWDTTNPMPEVAGLRAVSARLLELGAEISTADQRAYWKRVLDMTPELPTRVENGLEMLAPASRFEQKRNVENPELYAVFPFRLVSFEKDNAALGVAALANRWDRGAFGWRQDDLFMTHLGLAEQAKSNLVSRARNRHQGSRFPAFWGPNYDWIPDQDHGGVLMRTLQTMLLQTEGRKIFLRPAWPSGWDAQFKLHAPYQTTLTGRIVDGEVLDLRVEPASRAADVIIVQP